MGLHYVKLWADMDFLYRLKYFGFLAPLVDSPTQLICTQDENPQVSSIIITTALLQNSGALLSRIELPTRAMFSTPLTAPALYITFHFSRFWTFPIVSMFWTPLTTALYITFHFSRFWTFQIVSMFSTPLTTAL